MSNSGRYAVECREKGNESAPARTEQGPVIREAYTEVTLAAGDRYSFRTDGLLAFIAAGFEARLSALENT